MQEEQDIKPDIVSAEDARLALVPSISASAPPSTYRPSPPLETDENRWRWMTIGAFLAKVTLLFLPCSPYVCSARILWPLLGLAGLDILLYVAWQPS
jgi:hypothetical protein